MRYTAYPYCYQYNYHYTEGYSDHYDVGYNDHTNCGEYGNHSNTGYDNHTNSGYSDHSDYGIDGHTDYSYGNHTNTGYNNHGNTAYGNHTNSGYNNHLNCGEYSNHTNSGCSEHYNYSYGYSEYYCCGNTGCYDGGSGWYDSSRNYKDYEIRHNDGGNCTDYGYDNHTNSGYSDHSDYGIDGHTNYGYGNHSNTGYDNHTNSGYGNHTNSGYDNHVNCGEYSNHTNSGYDDHVNCGEYANHYDLGYNNHYNYGCNTHANYYAYQNSNNRTVWCYEGDFIKRDTGFATSTYSEYSNVNIISCSENDYNTNYEYSDYANAIVKTPSGEKWGRSQSVTWTSDAQGATIKESLANKIRQNLEMVNTKVKNPIVIDTEEISFAQNVDENIFDKFKSDIENLYKRLNLAGPLNNSFDGTTVPSVSHPAENTLIKLNEINDVKSNIDDIAQSNTYKDTFNCNDSGLFE